MKETLYEDDFFAPDILAKAIGKNLVCGRLTDYVVSHHEVLFAKENAANHVVVYYDQEQGEAIIHGSPSSEGRAPEPGLEFCAKKTEAISLLREKPYAIHVPRRSPDLQLGRSLDVIAGAQSLQLHLIFVVVMHTHLDSMHSLPFTIDTGHDVTLIQEPWWRLLSIPKGLLSEHVEPSSGGPVRLHELSGCTLVFGDSPANACWVRNMSICYFPQRGAAKGSYSWARYGLVNVLGRNALNILISGHRHELDYLLPIEREQHPGFALLDQIPAELPQHRTFVFTPPDVAGGEPPDSTLYPDLKRRTSLNPSPSEKRLPSLGATQEKLDTLSFGSHAYILRHPIEAQINVDKPGECLFIVSELGSVFTGKGKTKVEAKQDCLAKVHINFQKLVRKRPFQMKKCEREIWARLAQVIDVDAYNRTAPIILREVGHVQSVLSGGFVEVLWLNGRSERVSLQESTPELATYGKGRWFEAVVERKPGPGGEVLRVSHVTPAQPIKKMSPKDLDEFWSSLPVAKPSPDLGSPE